MALCHKMIFLNVEIHPLHWYLHSSEKLLKASKQLLSSKSRGERRRGSFFIKPPAAAAEEEEEGFTLIKKRMASDSNRFIISRKKEKFGWMAFHDATSTSPPSRQGKLIWVPLKANLYPSIGCCLATLCIPIPIIISLKSP